MDKNYLRKIIHVDMDAFFASIEQRDDPDLKLTPMAVGSNSNRGIIATASYLARQYGVYSAMSTIKAKQICPDLIIVEPRLNVYKQVSKQIMTIFKQFTDKVEQISVDEAFLDVTENKLNIDSAEQIAIKIKEQIFLETFLTCSIGVSYNKFLAKIGSDWNKPNGITIITQKDSQLFLDNLPVEKLWGVGHKTLNQMYSLGIYKVGDLKQKDLDFLFRHFGKVGKNYYDFARAIDNREIVTEHISKSVGVEHTFEVDISSWQVLNIELYKVVLALVTRINSNNFKGRRLTLKVKFNDFTTVSRSITQNDIFYCKEQILPKAKELLSQIDFNVKAVRLLGLSVSNNPNKKTIIQRDLFNEFE